MKKSTKNVIGIIAGVAVATASAILLGASKKNADVENDTCDETNDVDVTDSEEAVFDTVE